MSSRPVDAPRGLALVPAPDDRGLPHNEYLERLIVQFMVSDFAKETVAAFKNAGLTDDVFRCRDYRLVVGIVLQLHARGVVPVWYMVRSEVLKHNLSFDDPMSFEEIAVGVPPPILSNVPKMVAELRDLYEQRRLLARLHNREDPRIVARDFLEANERHDAAQGLDYDCLTDARQVAEEGQQIASDGIRFRVDGVIPDYGTLGILAAYAKVGKTSFGQALGAAVAMGAPFLNRVTTRARVLAIAAEDPSEYTAYVARHHRAIEPGWMTFYRRPIIFDSQGLARIVRTVKDGQYGLVLVSSWQAVVRGLVRDENDNAGAVQVVEVVKAAARATGAPWLIDAHSGKGEAQDDEADPSKAMRGASAVAGAADYTLFLRYANGTFGTQRKLSGKGRFVSFAPITMDYDTNTGVYTALTEANVVVNEATWRVILETGAITTEPRTVADIAKAAGLADQSGKVPSTSRRQVQAALKGRSGVATAQELRRGQSTTLYTLLTKGISA